MQKSEQGNARHLIATWLLKAFGEPLYEYPFPCVVREDMTIIVLLAEEIVEAREYTRTHPLPSPIVPVIIGTPLRSPPGRWVHVTRTELVSKYGDTRNGWYGVNLNEYKETIALMNLSTAPS